MAGRIRRKRREARRDLLAAGFELKRTSGSHDRYERTADGVVVVICGGNDNAELTSVEERNLRRALGGKQHPKMEAARG